KPPPTKTPEESRVAFESFESYVRFIAKVPDVRFVTASEVLRQYRDRAQGHSFTRAEAREIAAGVASGGTGYQVRGDYALSAAEVLALLTRTFVDERKPLALPGSPLGPPSAP